MFKLTLDASDAMTQTRLKVLIHKGLLLLPPMTHKNTQKFINIAESIDIQRFKACVILMLNSSFKKAHIKDCVIYAVSCVNRVSQLKALVYIALSILCVNVSFVLRGKY